MYWMNWTSIREKVVWMIRRWIYWSEGLLLVWIKAIMSTTYCKMDEIV